MNFTSQICTTKEQSERLLDLGLKAETADMSYFHTVGFEGNDLWLPSLSPYENVVKAPNYGEKTKIYIKSHTIPAWSLHRLLCLIPKEYRYDIDASQFFVDAMICSDPYTETIELIRLLLEDGYIYDEYLNA